jgi:hypothetical protein
MQFQLRTDNHIANSEGLAERVRAEIEGALIRRHADRLHRVDVYLQDTNAQKGGIDKRCSIEAHLAGYQSLAVHSEASNLDDAVSGAVAKLRHAVEHTLGRLHDRGGHVPMSGGPGGLS